MYVNTCGLVHTSPIAIGLVWIGPHKSNRYRTGVDWSTGVHIAIGQYLDVIQKVPIWTGMYVYVIQNYLRKLNLLKISLYMT